MKKTLFSFAFIAFALVAFTSCVKDRTSYTVTYSFDNTDMHTEMVKVFECIDGAATGKWRCDFHTYDTVTIDGVERQMVSGSISDVATGGANELWIYAEGDNKGMHVYQLDTIFRLIPGQDNQFTITPDSQWDKNPLYD